MTLPWVITFSVQTALLLIVAATLLGLMRRITPLLESSGADVSGTMARGPGGLEPGETVGPFTALDLSGNPVTLDGVRKSGDVLLLLRAACGPCEHLLESLDPASDREVMDRVLAVVSDPAEAELMGLSARGIRVVVQQKNAVFDALATRATPFAFVIGRDGRIAGKRIPTSADDLRALLVLTRERQHENGGERSSRPTEPAQAQ